MYSSQPLKWLESGLKVCGWRGWVVGTRGEDERKRTALQNLNRLLLTYTLQCKSKAKYKIKIKQNTRFTLVPNFGLVFFNHPSILYPTFGLDSRRLCLPAEQPGFLNSSCSFQLFLKTSCLLLHLQPSELGPKQTS